MSYSILLVEDDFLIADLVKDYITSLGWQITAHAFDYQEAVQAVEKHQFDIAILDINLGVGKTGIDFGHYLRSRNDLPFIYLTSFVDEDTLREAGETLPQGYLVKPVSLSDLKAAIIIAASFAKKTKNQFQNTIELKNGSKFEHFDLQNITHIQSDHVYVRVFLQDGTFYLHRGSLVQMEQLLPQDQFFRTHREYIINIGKVEAFDTNTVKISGKQIPISRSYKKDIIDLLTSMYDEV